MTEFSRIFPAPPSLRTCALALAAALFAGGGSVTAQEAEDTAAADQQTMAIAAPEVIPEGTADTAELPVAPETEAPVGVIERWRADPTTVFDATEIDLAALKYIARPLIILANSPNDPMVGEQLGYIEARFSALVARDVIVIVDTDPGSGSAIRADLRPRGFMMVLIGKDGSIALRRPFPWDVREITHTIDRLPIRQQELRDGTLSP